VSVTSELDSPTSTLSRYMRSTYPFVKWVQEDFRLGAPAVRVPKLGTANPGTLGGAFDWRVRWLLEPRLRATLAGPGAHKVRNGRKLLNGLTGLLTDASLTDGGEGETEAMCARACWVLSLFTEVTRLGLVMPGSPLTRLPAEPGLSDALSLAPDDAVNEIVAMTELAREKLLAPLAIPGAGVLVGPVADGTFMLSGDADFVIGETLVEMKATVGSKRPDGTRRLALPREELYQLVAYLLFAFPGTEGVRRLAMYSARFGHLATWDAESLLSQLAGQAVDLTHARTGFQAMLRTYDAAE
jgi:hypothetical protein